MIRTLLVTLVALSFTACSDNAPPPKPKPAAEAPAPAAAPPVTAAPAPAPAPITKAPEPAPDPNKELAPGAAPQGPGAPSGSEQGTRRAREARARGRSEDSGRRHRRHGKRRQGDAM